MECCKLSPPFPHKKKERLAKYSTFGIGGAADFFCIARSSEEMVQYIHFAKENCLRFIVIGKGSNLLFDDRGFKGLVILNKIEGLEQQENQFSVGSGYSFPRLGILTAKRSYHGLEFAAGIPASVGGAVYMNAGAGGQETFDTLEWVDFVDHDGILHHLAKKELTWGYRSSWFQTQKGAIVKVGFILSQKEKVYQNQKELVNYRINTQPYGMKSAGCVFRNPEGGSAGQVIEAMGLKGLRIGGVSVSTKHANFIVNDQGGTALDVKSLIEMIKTRLLDEKGISLQEEIRYIPYDV